MMREPVSTVTMQIGIVVSNLETTMPKCVDEYGLVRAR